MSYKNVAVKKVVESFFEIKKINDVNDSLKELSSTFEEIFRFPIEIKEINTNEKSFWFTVCFNDGKVENFIHVTVTIHNQIRVTDFN